MNLSEEARQLEARIGALPNEAKLRLIGDPEVLALLAQLQTLIEQIAEADTVDAFIVMEGQGESVITACNKVLKEAEIEVRLVGNLKEPACKFCGAAFPIKDPKSERAMWARFKRHVQTLHPKEFLAASK